MKNFLSIVTIVVFIFIAIYLIPNDSNGNSIEVDVPYNTVKVLKGDLIVKISKKELLNLILRSKLNLKLAVKFLPSHSRKVAILRKDKHYFILIKMMKLEMLLKQTQT